MADAVLTLRSCLNTCFEEGTSKSALWWDRQGEIGALLWQNSHKTASPPTLHQLYFLSCREDFPMLGLNGLMNFEAFLSVWSWVKEFPNQEVVLKIETSIFVISNLLT